MGLPLRIAFLLLASAVFCLADTNTYYVDTSGSDSNSGFLGSPFATVEKGLSVLAAGKTLKISSGQTFNPASTNALKFPDNTFGSNGLPVTVTTTGNESATIIFTNGNGLSVNKCNYAVVDNLRIVGDTNWITDGSITALHYGIYAPSASGYNVNHVTISRCEVLQCEVGIHFQITSSGGRFSDITISSNVVHDCLQDGIAMWDLSNPETATSMTNVVIAGNVISNIYGVTAVPGGLAIIGGFIHGLWITNNLMHDCGRDEWNGSGSSGGGAGVVLRGSENYLVAWNESYRMGANGGVDGIGIDMDISTRNGITEHNYCHDNDGPGFYLYGDFGGNILRYNLSVNNAILTNQHQRCEISIKTSTGTNESVYNNTIVSLRPDNMAFSAQNTTFYGTNIFANNICYSSNSLSLAITNTANTIVSGNDYYRLDGGTPQFNWGGTTYSGLAAFRTASGQETGTGFTVDPLFQGPVATLTNGSAWTLASLTNFVLQPSSPIARQGLSLSALYGLTMPAVDMAGNALQPSGYSVGCYDFLYALINATTLNVGTINKVQ